MAASSGLSEVDARLIDASREGLLDEVLACLEGGADVNAADRVSVTCDWCDVLW